ncbi:MAG: DUF3267 domain-containing protein [Bacteroidia bacterium]|nr:DUF3267 domain-containing protein [Bacteroidia bacterium]
MKEVLTPQNLDEKGYHLQDKLHHEQLVGFIKRYFFMMNPVNIFYWVFNVALLAAGVFLLWDHPAPGENVLKVFLGFFVFFLVIPVHELIHGIGYKLAGAEKVSYKAHWRQLVFYAMADRFVVSKIPFVLLALAPFLILNTAFIFLFCWMDEPWSWVMYGALIMHTAGCSGDFALISYFYTHWDKDPVTYDMVAGQESYFYVKNS